MRTRPLPSGPILASAALVTLLTVLGGCGGGTVPASEHPGAPGPEGPALPAGVQAISLLGEPLRTPRLPDDVRARYEANLAAARADAEADPADVDALIWLGRRTAYLGRYREAVDVFTRAIELAPEDPRLYRHRGHRYVTLRRFDDAVADLSHAARLIEGTEDEVEPDGIPNARGIPTSTLHFNVFYHLGLAHYLRGELEEARRAWAECMRVSKHPDSVVATAYWLQNTLRRLGLTARADAALADIHAGMDVIESTQYLDILLLWKGERTPDQLLGSGAEAVASVTTAYGVAVWYLLEGRPERASSMWRDILDGQGPEGRWDAFGYVAAEADIAAATGGRSDER